MFSESDFSVTFVFLRERKVYMFVWWEKRRKERTRYEILYLFIYLFLYVWKQEQNGNTTANAKYFEKNKKEASCCEKLILIKEKYFQEMNGKAEWEVGFYFHAF